MVRHHYDGLVADEARSPTCRRRRFELCEFLDRRAEGRATRWPLPHRVGLHQSCHGLRELRLGNDQANCNVARRSTKPNGLLSNLEGIRVRRSSERGRMLRLRRFVRRLRRSVSCMMGTRSHRRSRMRRRRSSHRRRYVVPDAPRRPHPPRPPARLRCCTSPRSLAEAGLIGPSGE